MIRMDPATLRDVWDGVRTQPGRVGLSFLAVMIGIIALTILMAVTSGLREKARLLVMELGADVVAILPPERTQADPESVFAYRHASLLAANLPGRRVSALKRQPLPLDSDDLLLNLVLTDDSLAELRQWTLDAGRFLDRRDVLNAERHAVITRSLSRRQNWNVGATIVLRSLPFVVVGVLAPGGSASEAESADARLQIGDHAVFVPYSVYAPWSAGARPEARAMDAIFVRGRPGERMEGLVAACRHLLNAPDTGATGLQWITPESLLSGIRRMQQTIRLSVGSIAMLCLVLGGTTLMSLMLANVRDRVTEIGLRRALGARARDVSLLFVLEACAITLAAAAVGTALAGAMLGLAGSRFPVPLRLGGWTFLLPVLASLGLGVIFSYWPARMAARIAPADALRNE